MGTIERRAVEPTMVVASVGKLVETGEPLCPYRLIGPDGTAVDAVSVFFAELLAWGRRSATLRSYGMDLLRWFRFCWAAGVAWDAVTQREAREFSLLLEVAPKPVRPHWRHQDPTAASIRAAHGQYSPAVRVHSETVLRSFYDFHADAGSGPAKNPFPLDRSRRSSRANAHHNPMEPYRNASSGRYRPSVASRVPRAIPDAEFNEIFARLRSNRDRALVCFYVSTGARASELLSARRNGVDPGRGVISVVRKGSRASQELPASQDAFVFLRLYEVEMEGLVPKGRRAPLFFTLRRPYRPLTYHAVHRMFERVNAEAGTSSTLHSLRHILSAYLSCRDWVSEGLCLAGFWFVGVGVAFVSSAVHDPELLLVGRLAGVERGASAVDPRGDAGADRRRPCLRGRPGGSAGHYGGEPVAAGAA